MKIKRGDIFYADLSPVIGSEQAGVRPVLVIQNDIGNKYSPTVIVLAITTKNKSNIPTHINVKASECGLEKDSTILVEQVRTLDKIRLKEKIGSLDNETMEKVKKALKISLNIRYDFDELFYDW